MKGAWGPFKPPSVSALTRARAGAAPLHFALQRCVAAQWKVYGGARYLQTSAKESIGAGFSYKITAAFTGKTNIFDRKTNFYTFDSDTGEGQYADPALAQKGRKIPSGQDSFFVGSIGDSSAAAFGVADGVGGYQQEGIDSAIFAHGICRHMKTVAGEFGSDKSAKRRLDPQQLLSDGHDRVCQDKAVEGGASTACVAVAEPDGVLNVANLGDSGFAHFRLNAVQFHSPPQQHQFNQPLQLTIYGPKEIEQMKKYGYSESLPDTAKDADVTSHELKHGDVLVFGTDGLWDNLSPQDVLERVSRIMMESGAWTLPKGQGVQASISLPYLTDEAMVAQQKPEAQPLQTTLAVDITAKAKLASVNQKRDGPFAKQVKLLYPAEHYHGGKRDDICVLVVVVVDQDAG